MKRILSLVMILALVLSLGFTAMAEEAVEEPATEEVAEEVTEEVEEEAVEEEAVEEEAEEVAEEAVEEEAVEEEAVEEEVAEEVAEEPTPQEVAGAMLVEAGIVQGYPDGSLGLENTITRAEMAAVIVRTAGMGAEAEAMLGEESMFSDVAAEAWYSGVVNVAAAEGWVTGDPEGTFRPNDPVQYREAVTMVLRALGYSNDSLEGVWPENYVSMAAELGLAADMELDSREAAPRGDVFVILADTVDFETGSFNLELMPVVEEEAVEEEAVEEEAEEVAEEAVEEEETEEESEEVVEESEETEEATEEEEETEEVL